jgi:8-oxo-dGTP pyrophosphatase MutT (NUDIX family)
MSTRPLFQRFAKELTQRLSHPLPGTGAQRRMAPPFRPSSPEFPETVPNSREAAVLVLFFPSDARADEVELLLTVRPEGMLNHAGQVAFPGGRREDGEDLPDTAIRETEEEVLIESSSIQLAGALTPLYIPPSNFIVHPFVGIVDSAPDMTVTTDEVARCFGVTVAHLTDPDVVRLATQKWKSNLHEVPYFALNGEFVWGATAMILSELVALLTRPLD